MNNAETEVKPNEKLTSFSMQDEQGHWWNISEVIPSFQVINLTGEHSNEKDSE